MSRVIFFHWNADEAKERAGRLRRHGHTVVTYSKQGGEGLRAFREKPPHAFVIDLSRLPSHGRAVATWLRQQRPTRLVPIIFVGGAPDKLRLVRKVVPDATYTEWTRIRGALSRAIANPPQKAVVPDTMAGYSGTPLPKKLGIKVGAVVALLGAPKHFERTLGQLPDDVQLKRQARGTADLIVMFARSRADLDRRFPAAKRALTDKGGLWIAWPKKASGVATDLTQNDVRGIGLKSGLVDYKICAIDETWSGLLFSRRRKSAKGR